MENAVIYKTIFRLIFEWPLGSNISRIPLPWTCAEALTIYTEKLKLFFGE